MFWNLFFWRGGCDWGGRGVGWGGVCFLCMLTLGTSRWEELRTGGGEAGGRSNEEGFDEDDFM